MVSDFGIRTEQLAEHVWLISLTGEHDLSTAGALANEVAGVFARGSVAILDLTAASFIDSAVVSTIAAGSEQARQRSEDRLLVIAPPDSKPRRVLDVVNASSFADVFDDRRQAIVSATH
jgi:anti-anti-sigma factor